MSLLPSAPTPAPSETHRSLSAPGAWGRQASPPRQRHCPPALPAHLPKNHRRRQAPAREPVTVCPHTRPKRNAPQPVCPRLVGQTGVTPAQRHCPPALPAHLPKNHRRRQAPAREPVTVCSHTRPKRNAPQPACPGIVGQTGVTPAPTHCPPALPPTSPKTTAGDRLLLVSLSPSAPTPVPSETHRSLPAPGAWGRQASPRANGTVRRHCRPRRPEGRPCHERQRKTRPLP